MRTSLTAAAVALAGAVAFAPFAAAWDADAHAEATAKSGQKGGAYEGAISVAPGVWVYQLTETGLAVHATLQGTKYYKNDDLN